MRNMKIEVNDEDDMLNELLDGDEAEEIFKRMKAERVDDLGKEKKKKKIIKDIYGEYDEISEQ